MPDVEDWGAAEVSNRCCGGMICRSLAPDIFTEVKVGTSRDGRFSIAARELRSQEEYQLVRQAMFLCPTKAIRMVRPPKDRGATGDRLFVGFPKLVEDGVYFLGHDSSGNFGSMGYFVARPDGMNILIDPPSPDPALLESLTAMGGVQMILFTHKDHTHHHQEWHDLTGAPRLIHTADVHRRKDRSPFPITSGMEHQASLHQGQTMLMPGCAEMVIIGTPGHTAGSLTFLYKEKFLFTGDSLAWSQAKGHLTGHRIVCWQDWGTQTQSLEFLRHFKFVWVLPGHGDWHHFASIAEAQESLDTCLAWMRTQRRGYTHFLRFLLWTHLRRRRTESRLWYWLADNIVLPGGAKDNLPNAVAPSALLYGVGMLPLLFGASWWLRRARA